MAGNKIPDDQHPASENLSPVVYKGQSILGAPGEDLLVSISSMAMLVDQSSKNIMRNGPIKIEVQRTQRREQAKTYADHAFSINTLDAVL